VKFMKKLNFSIQKKVKAWKASKYADNHSTNSFYVIQKKNVTLMTTSLSSKKHSGCQKIFYKVPLFLLCQIILAECPTNLNLAPLLSIVVYALNLFWFQFDLVLYIRQ